MRSIKFIVPFAAAFILTFTSCHKKETVEVDNETQSVVDNAVAEQEFFAIVPAVNSMAIKTKGTGADKNRSASAACDSLHLYSGDTLFSSPTHVHPTYSLTVANPTCSPIPDSKIRGGDVWIKFYGRLKTAGSRMVLTLMNYQAANIDPLKKITYSCDSIVVKTISSSTTERVFNVKIFNGKCVGPPANPWTTTYTTDRTITHNFTTGDVSIFGTSNGVNREGRKFNVTVDPGTPLVKHESCQFISSGIVKLTPDGFKERTVDYTSGSGVDHCDDDAIFIVNGNKVAFKLK